MYFDPQSLPFLCRLENNEGANTVLLVKLQLCNIAVEAHPIETDLGSHDGIF